MLENLTEAFSDLEPVSPRGGAYEEGSTVEEEKASNLTVGQFVLCHWSDGLYYLGKIQRVTHTHTQTHSWSVWISCNSVL